MLPAEPAASEPATPPGLTLALPRTRAGQPGAPRTLLGDSLAEQRQLAPGGSFSERMSRALGTVQARVEEPLNGDSIRLRQGNDCVVVSRSRESQLDPFNQSVNPSAHGVTPCR